MTDKNKINETDLQDVAGGRSDANRPTAAPSPELIGDPKQKGTSRPLTAEEAASVSAGRQSPTPTATPVPTDESGVPQSETIKPRGEK